MDETGCNCQTFSLSLKQQEKTNYKCQNCFPLLYTNLKGGFFSNSVLPWWHLVPPELKTSLKSWANQCFFLWKYFSIFPKYFLSYVKELCIYPRLCLHFSSPKTQNQLDKPVCFTHANVLLSYVNETMSLLGNQPFFKIHINCFLFWDNSPCANIISKCMLWVRGLVPVSEFWDISFH